MPALSIKQRRAMAIAEHNPNELFAKDKGMLSMSHSQLHDFAATPEADLVLSKGDAKGNQDSDTKKAMKRSMKKK